MASQTFFCPSCGTQLTKSAQAYVLGEAYEHNTTVFISGSPPADVSCPRCGGRIDSMKMIRGEFDGSGSISRARSKNDGWYVFGMLAGPFICRFVFHWSWIVSIFAGLIGGAIIAGIIAETLRPSGRN